MLWILIFQFSSILHTWLLPELTYNKNVHVSCWMWNLSRMMKSYICIRCLHTSCCASKFFVKFISSERSGNTIFLWKKKNYFLNYYSKFTFNKYYTCSRRWTYISHLCICISKSQRHVALHCSSHFIWEIDGISSSTRTPLGSWWCGYTDAMVISQNFCNALYT